MRFFFFPLKLFILLSFHLSKEANITKDVIEDLQTKISELEEKLNKVGSSVKDSPDILAKRREENEKKYYAQINHILKELGLENLKKITREQFKQIFVKLLEKNKNKTKEKSVELPLMKKFTEQIVDNLVSKDKDYIEVDKINEYFQPQNIANAVKVLLKGLGLDSHVDTFTESIMKSFGSSSLNNNETKTEEKNSDL